jgi:hypothetical protein
VKEEEMMLPIDWSASSPNSLAKQRGVIQATTTNFSSIVSTFPPIVSAYINPPYPFEKVHFEP